MLLPFINFASIGKLVSAFIGCGLVSGICITAPLSPHQNIQQHISTPAPYSEHVSMQTIATSSPDVTVMTDINGKKNTRVVRAPYGIRSSILSTSNGSTTKTTASTTPLSRDDEIKMQQQMQERMDTMQQQMNQMFKDQQQMFGHAFSDF